MPKGLFRYAALGGILLATVNCGKKEAIKPPAPEAPQAAAPAPATTPVKAEKGAPTAEGAPFLKVPLGLDTNLNIPADNPLTPEKIELGRLLYFDKRLSKDVTISCASCHDPKRGWTDNQPVSDGIHGGKGTRSAPTVINSTYNLVQFWDGRAKNLEEQALGPIINPVEMGMASHDEMINSLSNIQSYRPLFQKAFGDDKITKERVAMAIASFERTVLGGNSKFDRYSNGDKTAMNESEIRGRELFFGKANCTRCHVGSNFSDSDFHNLGVGMSKAKPDLGRYEISKEEKDKGAFKTPTVRDISRTAPYMHDGSVATLEEVVDLYDRGGEPNKWLDVKVVKLNLTPQEKADLVAFMKALDSDPYPMVEDPKTFPQ